MIIPDGSLSNVQRALHGLFSFPEFPLSLQRERQLIQNIGHIRIVGPEETFAGDDQLPKERLRRSETPLLSQSHTVRIRSGYVFKRDFIG